MRVPKTWVLVADGSRARIVRQIGRAGSRFAPGDEVVLQSEIKPLREIMADAPGRAFPSVGARRSAMEYHSDPVKDAMRDFAATIVTFLEERTGEFDQLVVMAAPQMLGFLREAMPPALKRVTVAEVPKDLTKLPEIELQRKIVAMFPRSFGAPPA